MNILKTSVANKHLFSSQVCRLSTDLNWAGSCPAVSCHLAEQFLILTMLAPMPGLAVCWFLEDGYSRDK
jgi:hypothetical protein